MNRKFRAGVIGLGNIGYQYSKDPLRTWISSHLEAYIAQPQFECVAICDINLTRLQEAHTFCPQARPFQDWKQMMKEMNLDIVSLCVSPEFQAEFCESSIPKGLRMILFEKPFSPDFASGEVMLAELKRKNIIGLVNHFQRWQPTFRRAKEWIEKGTIGELRHLIFMCGGGLLKDGIHAMDLARFLGGELKMETLQIRDLDQNDDVLASLYGRSHSGAEVWFLGCDKKDYAVFQVDVWGSEGRILIENHGRTVLRFAAEQSPRFSHRKELRSTEEFSLSPQESHFKYFLEDALLLLRGEPASSSACTLEDGLEAVKLISLLHDNSRS